MKIAVTGASGFVGTHVLRALARRGDVEIIAASRTPIAADRLPAGARHVVLDLKEGSGGDYDRLGRPDLLIHLAWGGLPNYRSLHHFEVELPAHYRFLGGMVDAGLPAMLVTGTCYEYGMVDGELAEDRDPAPANPYAFAKAALCRQLAFLKDRTPFALTWARLFYMYGEGQAPTSIYPLLCSAIARGDASFPMSAGEQLRDYLPIEEVAGLLVDLALLRQDLGIVNISSGQPTSIRSLVERWIVEAGADIATDLSKFPYPSYEPLAFWGCTTKRRAILPPSA